MLLRSVAAYGALAGALGVACGGRVDLGSLAGADDAGSSLDATASVDADAVGTGSSDGVAPNEGACPNAAINVRGRACYEQALVQPSALGPNSFCECGAIRAPDARCIDGQCTYCGGGGCMALGGGGGAPNLAPPFFSQ